MFYDTIAAISTPAGQGGIAIVRMSGRYSVEIADKIFVNPNGRTLKNAKANTITYGHIRTPSGEITDEVLVSLMRAPHSYTAEDVIEINCHGGNVSAAKILSALIEAGACLASPGEFTKRAFLNGRIDLSQAESVIDIINSKTNLAHSIAVNQLGGRLSSEINKIRDTLIELLSHVQVLIDYPEEDLEPLSDEEFMSLLVAALRNVNKLLATAEQGRIVQNGVMTAIVGKPNVGKSSLMNLLSGEERAIVTDIEGTTRDVIEEYIRLGNIPLRIADTAGIRETADIIESIGVEKTKKCIDDAQLIIFMLDGTKAIDENDRIIIEMLRERPDKQVIVLINKTECGCVFDPSEIKAEFVNTLLFSVREGSGVDALEALIASLFNLGNIAQDDGNIITNIRHKEALANAKSCLENARRSLEEGAFCDIVSIDIQNAVSSLGEITGTTVSEEIVDKIFHGFCVGK